VGRASGNEPLSRRAKQGRGLAEASKLVIFDARLGHVGATPQPKQTVASHANEHRRCRKATVPTSAATTNLFWKALTR
jgi:hypothetical protein